MKVLGILGTPHTKGNTVLLLDAVLEGAAAPTAQARSRSQVTNVCQIHQEKVSVSYSKLAAVGRHDGLGIEALGKLSKEPHAGISRTHGLGTGMPVYPLSLSAKGPARA